MKTVTINGLIFILEKRLCTNLNCERCFDVLQTSHQRVCSEECTVITEMNLGLARKANRAFSPKAVPVGEHSWTRDNRIHFRKIEVAKRLIAMNKMPRKRFHDYE